MKVTLPDYKGHSPKNKFLEEWVADFLTGRDLDGRVSEGLVLPQLPKWPAEATVTIEYGISHGKSGAVLARVTGHETVKWLSFHLEFRTFKAEEIASIIMALG